MAVSMLPVFAALGILLTPRAAGQPHLVLERLRLQLALPLQLGPQPLQLATVQPPQPVRLAGQLAAERPTDGVQQLPALRAARCTGRRHVRGGHNPALNPRPHTDHGTGGYTQNKYLISKFAEKVGMKRN